MDKMKWTTISMENYYTVLTLDKMKWMTISMENCYFICDTGQVEINDNQYGELLFHLWHWTRWNEWQSLWRIAITFATLDKLKSMTISLENCYYICDTGQDEVNNNQYGESLLQLWHWTKWNEWQSLWRIAISFVMLDKMKWMTISMENCYFSCDNGQDEMNDNQYGELLFTVVTWTRWSERQSVWRITIQFWHWTRWNEWQSLWRIAITFATLDKLKSMTISLENCYYICDTGQDEVNNNQYGESLLQLWHWTRWSEWQSVWRITTCILVVVLNKVKWMTTSMENCYYICDKMKWMTISMENCCYSCDTGQDEMNNDQYGK